MIFPDVNILLYVFDRTSKFHLRSKDWFEKLVADRELLGLSWHTIMGFVRISTNSRLFPNPLPTKDALAVVRDLLGLEDTVILAPTDDHFTIFSRLVAENHLQGPRLMDAHIAAIAIGHGATLASNDRDFRSFAGLRLVDPLETDS